MLFVLNNTNQQNKTFFSVRLYLGVILINADFVNHCSFPSSCVSFSAFYMTHFTEFSQILHIYTFIHMHIDLYIQIYTDPYFKV